MIELSNDDIKFKKYYSKYMESFKSFNENIDDYDDWEDDFMSDSDVPDDDIGELCFWLKKMYEANKLEVEVEPDYSGKISIFLLLKKKEKISTLLSIMEITEKIKKDFLNYHDVEVELYESKSGYPIFAIDFTTNGDDTSDNYDEPF